MKRVILTCAFAALVPTFVSGCGVSSVKYDAAVKSAADSRAELKRVKDASAASLSDLQKKIDDATAEDARLRTELERLGTNVDALLAEKGTLASALKDSKMRLEELRRAQAAAESRAQLYRDLALRLKQMVDAGDLSIALRDGKMVLLMPNDVLFDTGQTEIKARGKEALKQLASVLKSIEGRHFQVAGHTDNVPIETARFPSNWELSSARGLVVVHFLLGQGVSATKLSAAGYSEFDPVASNDDPKSRARNRRIEITLQPNVNEIVSVPEPR